MVRAHVAVQVCGLKIIGYTEHFVGYGDIMKLETTGASLRTAKQDNLDYTGKPFCANSPTV